MTHSHIHSKSKNQWFRMDVPKRLHALAGTTSWKQSLGTADPRVAGIKRAQLTAHYKAEILRLDGRLAAQSSENACDLIDRALDLLATQKGSLDIVVRAILTFIALRARQSWGREHQHDAIWDFGLAPYMCEDAHDLSDLEGLEPFPTFEDEQARAQYVMRHQLVERRGLADGITLQELASRLLEQRGFSHVAFDAAYLLRLVGAELKEGSSELMAASEHLLRRLAEHRFNDWQPNFSAAVAPLAGQPLLTSKPTVSAATMPPVAPATPPIVQVPNPFAANFTISAVFADWYEHSRATPKSKDEFGRCISRFVAHFGDLPVELITKRVVVEWKRLLPRLPSQPKDDVAALPPAEQALRAEAEGLRRLSGKTATKYMQALRSTLKHARDEMLIIEGVLATEGVRIDVDEDESVDIQPFSEEQMALIFSQPVMIDPDTGDDETFWFLLSAPLTGCRIEETAQLRPTNIRAEKNIPFIAIERDRIAERRKTTASGGVRKRLKTKLTTKRNIPVHWILQEAGFLEFARLMQEREAEWLFEDLIEYKAYDQRGKYMSNKIMRFLRRIGIKDRENVYHSFRHSLKRELRDDEQTKEEISDLLTGHSFSESVGRQYARGAGLTTLAAAIDRISYDTVDWDRVVATGQARVARLRRRLGADS